MRAVSRRVYLQKAAAMEAGLTAADPQDATPCGPATDGAAQADVSTR